MYPFPYSYPSHQVHLCSIELSHAYSRSNIIGQIRWSLRCCEFCNIVINVFGRFCGDYGASWECDIGNIGTIVAGILPPPPLPHSVFCGCFLHYRMYISFYKIPFSSLPSGTVLFTITSYHHPSSHPLQPLCSLTLSTSSTPSSLPPRF